jgi:enterochelin esterase family protein
VAEWFSGSEMTNGGLMPSMVYVSRHMGDVLVAKGYDVAYREYPGGYEWWYWGELLADGVMRFAGKCSPGEPLA